MLSGRAHRSITDGLSNTVAAVKTKNVPAEPISSARAGIRVARLTANPTTARANATNTATSDGALPTSTQ